MTSADVADRSWDERYFRTVLGHFCSGITIIAAMDAGRPVGMTCQSFFSVSVDPPLVAFSVARTSTSFPSIRAAGSCAINVLAGDQGPLSDQFSRSGTDKWAGVGWTPGEATGNPIIDDVLAWLECDLYDEFDAGDHTLVLGRVRHLYSRVDSGPLLYFRGGYGLLGDPSASDEA